MASDRKARALIAWVALGVFVAADDQTSIVTLLPSIISDIGLTVDDFYRSSWIVNGYLLGYLVALPIVGRIADVYGRARVFAACIGFFVVGSALVAVSHGYTWLVMARALQAVGGGGVVPVAMAIVAAEVPQGKRLLGLGAIAAASEGGALLGPLWGGVITDIAGWRWVFWVNLPMAAPIGYAIWRLAGDERQRGRIDWPGAALLGLSLTILTFAFVDDPNDTRPLVTTLAMVAAALAVMAAFWWHEAHTPEPMVRPSLLARREVLAANLASVLLGCGLITALVGVPLFVNLVLVESPLDGGFTLMRLTAAVPVGALAGGWLGSRLGLRLTASIGMLLAATGFLGLQAWDTPLSQVLRSGPQVIGGLGFGLVIAPLGAAVLHGVAENSRATVSAWLTLSRVTGMLLGTAVLTSTGLGRFYARASQAEFGSPDFDRLISEAQVVTFREVFVAGVVVMVAAALVSIFIGRGAPDDRDAPWWTAS
ncbi:MAG: MFS transporter [Dehalococcoidia bacterium]|nr:MAG: MFS transporter [Dehalococcoidia bacterium]